MTHVGWMAVMFIAVSIAPALADDRLPIRPGMGLDQVTQLLKPTCRDYFFNGTETKHVTCIRGEGYAPEVVTAKINSADQTVYIQWRHLSGTSPADAEATARSLGFDRPGTDCAIFSEVVPCWLDADGATIFDGGHNAKDGIHSFFFKKKGLE